MKRIHLFIILYFSTFYAFAETAIFAGGCFWCTQADLAKLAGVKTTQVGYDGGMIKKPTYSLVSSGKTNYVESVKVQFDPTVITYKKLLYYFLRTIDVTQANGQFCDIGPQYRSVIFYLNSKQKKIAQQVLKEHSKIIANIKTELIASTQFKPGEDYHQNYATKNPARYKYYRWRCGRDKQLNKLWGNND